MKKLLTVINNPADYVLLQVELAASVDGGDPFVRFTYNNEGDGPMVLFVHERLLALDAHVAAPHVPNLTAVCRALAVDNPANERALQQHGLSCILPGFQYWVAKKAELADQLVAYKAAAVFLPTKAKDSTAQQLQNLVRGLANFPFLKGEDVDGLLRQLPAYIAAVAHLPDQQSREAESISAKDPLEFWREHKGNADLTVWVEVLRRVLLVQPSSAAAERVFSLLANTFGPQQTSALSDYIEASLMRQYNH